MSVTFGPIDLTPVRVYHGDNGRVHARVLPRQTRNGIAYRFMATPATMLTVATGVFFSTEPERQTTDQEYRTATFCSAPHHPRQKKCSTCGMGS